MAKKTSPQEKTRLSKGLATYGLDSPAALGKAIGVSKQHAHQILTGSRHSRYQNRPYRIGVKIAKRIGAVTGLPFTLLLEWQENGR